MEFYTWEDFQKDWDSWDTNRRDGFMCYVANFHPELEFADYLAKTHAVPETSNEIPKNALEAYRDSPHKDHATIAKHPTLGWFVVIGDSDPAKESAIIYHPEVPKHLFAMACAEYYAQSATPNRSASDANADALLEP